MMMNNCVRSEVLRENFRPGTDTVAAIMWSNPVVLPPLCRVNEAIERVRQVGLPDENMNSCYVVEMCIRDSWTTYPVLAATARTDRS